MSYWKDEQVRKAIYIRIVSGLILTIVGALATALVIIMCGD